MLFHSVWWGKKGALEYIFKGILHWFSSYHSLDEKAPGYGMCPSLSRMGTVLWASWRFACFMSLWSVTMCTISLKRAVRWFHSILICYNVYHLSLIKILSSVAGRWRGQRNPIQGSGSGETFSSFLSPALQPLCPALSAITIEHCTSLWELGPVANFVLDHRPSTSQSPFPGCPRLTQLHHGTETWEDAALVTMSRFQKIARHALSPISPLPRT